MNRANQCPQGVISREALISYEMLIRLKTYAIFHAPVTGFPYPNPKKKQRKLQYHLPKPRYPVILVLPGFPETIFPA